ncbi:hypothetical protein FOZ60_011551 [Perkinsus olseni]|uniref:Uncharacterized protein n=1 Tax=Perkinsus olseni TaxID=32597 RepID=A0A7J6NE67_PEROL|nr:hypothetical protein FOZ60_011551 [Perkinsus olseni]
MSQQQQQLANATATATLSANLLMSQQQQQLANATATALSANLLMSQQQQQLANATATALSANLLMSQQQQQLANATATALSANLLMSQQQQQLANVMISSSTPHIGYGNGNPIRQFADATATALSANLLMSQQQQLANATATALSANLLMSQQQQLANATATATLSANLLMSQQQQQLANVGSAFVILPDSHLVENLPPREPLVLNLVTAFSLSIWTSSDVPTLLPYLSAIRGSTDRRITLTIIICLTLSVVYVYIIGLAGMQICDGVCKDFYPASLAGFPPAALPPWLVYCMYAFILLRMFVLLPILTVPLMVACETVVGRLLSCTRVTSKLSSLKGWRLAVRCLLIVVAALGAILVKRELAYFQAIASTLLTSCSLYLCPLWFYAYVMRPAGIKLWAVYVSGFLVAAFVVVGTYTSITGIISGSPVASTESL